MDTAPLNEHIILVIVVTTFLGAIVKGATNMGLNLLADAIREISLNT